ncbi:MAG: E3 ubiquitin-protein ligase rad18 [Candelina submexicana]|nr:MAG: E3 ubiquitin-protein ligase rad18 [Candelina submexicana]
MRLRRNWTVQELVDSFQAARPELLKLARDVETPSTDNARRTSKRKLDDTDLETEDAGRASQTRKTRSQSRRSPALSSNNTIVVLDDEEDGDYHPEDGLVPCPVCQRRMKHEEVFSHLDRCSGGSSNTTHTKNTKARPSPPRKPSSQHRTQNPPPERLPKLNYSLMKDTAIRKKFQELGIPGWGSKPLLIRRHTEWVNLWNANCDSSRPRSKRELLQDLDVWERSQGGHAPNTNGGVNGGSSLMRKDFDGRGWAASHSEDFRQLIANARKKKKEEEEESTPTPDTEAEETKRNQEQATENHARYLLDAAESPNQGPANGSDNGERNGTKSSRTVEYPILDSDKEQSIPPKGNISPTQPPNPPTPHQASTTTSTSPHFTTPLRKNRLFDDIQDQTRDQSCSVHIK